MRRSTRRELGGAGAAPARAAGGVGGEGRERRFERLRRAAAAARRGARPTQMSRFGVADAAAPASPGRSSAATSSNPASARSERSEAVREREDVLVARDVVEVAVLAERLEVRDRDVDQAAGARRAASSAQRRARVAEVLERVLSDDELERRFAGIASSSLCSRLAIAAAAPSGLDPGRLPAVGRGEHSSQPPIPQPKSSAAAGSSVVAGSSAFAASSVVVALRARPRFWTRCAAIRSCSRDPAVPAVA